MSRILLMVSHHLAIFGGHLSSILRCPHKTTPLKDHVSLRMVAPHCMSPPTKFGTHRYCGKGLYCFLFLTWSRNITGLKCNVFLWMGTPYCKLPPFYSDWRARFHICTYISHYYLSLTYMTWKHMACHFNKSDTDHTRPGYWMMKYKQMAFASPSKTNTFGRNKRKKREAIAELFTLHANK